MKIKIRLTINFLISVIAILFIFSATVYFFYLRHRSEDFLTRLRYKAINTATMLFKIEGVNPQLLKIIDDNSVTAIDDASVIIINRNGEIIYSSVGPEKTKEEILNFRKLNWNKEDHLIRNKKLYISFITNFNQEAYFVLASGKDNYGHAELNKLLLILILVFIFSILIILFFGYFNASQALKPIKEIIRQVDKINASSLNNRLTIKNKDEIDELAVTFNKMLARLEQSFETEHTFVSNVSHELRTPVTSIIGQLEVALLKARTEQEYKNLMNSILEDIRNMKTIINGFLDLAEAGMQERKEQNFGSIRMDELLFDVKEEILKRKPHYSINVDFENVPEDENEVSVMGNERLLKILLINLIDNACKFSEQHQVMIRIGYNNFFLTLRFADNGIGIPEDELTRITQPLYRAKNAMGKGGHGIGLSIVKRIADLHHATLDIRSEINVGTTVTLMFPNIKTA